jgi:hypothetical protein
VETPDGPFLDGGRSPTPARVYRLLKAVLGDGGHVELDLRTEDGHTTLPIGDVVAVSRSLKHDGFRLLDQNGTEILTLDYPPYFIDWYLPPEESRDGWARIRFHEAIKRPGKRGLLRTSWIRLKPAEGAQASGPPADP